MKRLHTKLFLGVLVVSMWLPLYLYADEPSGAQTPLRKLIVEFSGLVGTLTGVIAGLALLVFFWGLVRYIASAGDEKSKDSGKRTMVGGVIALFVMFSVFGIVQFLQKSFDLDGASTQMTPPSIKF